MDVIVPAGNEITIELTEMAWITCKCLCSNWNASEYRLIFNTEFAIN